MLPSHCFPRLKFSKGKQSEFINNLCKKKHLSANEIAKEMSIPPRTFNNWQREKYNISRYWLSQICIRLHTPFPNKINHMQVNWERDCLRKSKKGGLARFRIYGNPATPEGCRKGGIRTLKILRDKGIIAPCKNFLLPRYKSTKLAEFFGIMLGDGGLTKLQATITLNSEAVKNYIEYVSKLGEHLFSDKPSMSAKKSCKATDLRFSGLKLVEYLVGLGLQTGNKVKNQVDVPDWIKNSKQYKMACLKGLMDTDGCIVKSHHKYKSKNYIYHNPCFANRSLPLLRFVTNTLIYLGLHPSVAGERVWLYNRPELRKYFELVGSNNSRLLKFKEESHSWSIAEVR